MRRPGGLLLAITAGLAIAPAAPAMQDRELIAQHAIEAGLHQHPDWLRLLYFDSRRQASKVVSPGFLLAPDGRHSPEAELRATIAAFFAPVTDDPDEHPRCRFPARYYWLGRHIDLDAVEALTCPRLENWALFDQLRSISVVMVSGYFGNPASSFGHLLLKLNNSKEQPGAGLLDLGINYGAAVPDNELTALYVLRGLFGGYQAGFSDKLYYTQDLAYSRIEFRDMWEYELNLPEDQVRLIVYHLWESLGQRFAYFFLKENCAFRLAELLELGTGQSFTSGVSLWYAPVSFFHRLNDFNTSVGGTLIRSVRFAPSSQRLLYHEFDQLSPAEQRLLNQMLRRPDLLNSPDFAALPNGPAARLLDVLLAYHQYRLVPIEDSDDSTAARALRARKEEILRVRLTLPPAQRADMRQVPVLTPPADGSKPSAGGLGPGWNSEFGSFLHARYTAFHYDMIGRNNLAGSELVVFDVAVGYAVERKLFLDRFDFVRARKVNLNTGQIAGENRWSWQVGVGLQRDSLACTSCNELYATGGIGRARAFGPGLTAYGMLNANLESRGAALLLRPNLGLLLQQGPDAVTHLSLGWERSLSSEVDRFTWKVESRWSLAIDREIRLTVARQEATELTLGLQHYW